MGMEAENKLYQKKWEPGFSCTKEESFWIGVKIPDGSELSNLYLSKSSLQGVRAQGGTQYWYIQ